MLFPPLTLRKSDRSGQLILHVVYWSEYDRGGHFAAIEAPDLYAADLIKFFSLLHRR
jgi:hypothetical protein